MKLTWKQIISGEYSKPCNEHNITKLKMTQELIQKLIEEQFTWYNGKRINLEDELFTNPDKKFIAILPSRTILYGYYDYLATRNIPTHEYDESVSDESVPFSPQNPHIG